MRLNQSVRLIRMFGLDSLARVILLVHLHICICSARTGFQRLKYALSKSSHEHSKLHKHLLSNQYYDKTLYPPSNPANGRGVNVSLQLWLYDIIHVVSV